MAHRMFRLLFALALLTGFAHASYFSARPVEVRQPDGSLIQVLVTGDEFYAKVEAPEGCALIKDAATGWYDLARYDAAKVSLESRGIHYSPKLGATVKAPSAGIALPDWKVREIRTAGRSHRDRTLIAPGARAKAFTTPSLQSLKSPSLTAPSASALAAPATVAPAGTGGVNDTYVGDITGLTVLVDFPDDASTHSPVLVDKILNQHGFTAPNLESTVYDFYLDASGGKLRYKNIVMNHWYRAPMPKGFYEGYEASQDLIKEILAHLESQGFDFSRLTVGSDGQVRAFNVMYAGGVAGWSPGLWPHAGVLDNGKFEADGVFLSRHQISGLMHDYTYVGTFCHETGHSLMGWNDLYDPDGGGAGVGPYSIMGFDNWAAPQRPDPYLRVRAGWDQIVDINTAPSGTRLTIGANEGKVFRFKNPARPEEAFLIDARPTRSKHWPHDRGGLAVWHVDDEVWNNNYEEMTEEFHYLISLEQSDASFGLEAGNGEGSRNIFFHTGTRTVFHDGTAPNARWWNGDESNLSLKDITGEPSAAGSVSFQIGSKPVLTTHTITTVPGAQGQILKLPAPCNLPYGAEGTGPAQGNFGTVPKVGDRVFLDADGSSYGVPLKTAGAWWLGFSWTTPYHGPGNANGACSVERGGGPAAHGRISPQGPFKVTTGRTQTFRFFSHAGYIIQDVRVDGVSVGAVESYTLHNIAANHRIEAVFAPGVVLRHFTVTGLNGPGAYVGTGDYPNGTWVNMGATPFPGYTFDHWIVNFGEVRIENIRANPGRAFLNSNAVVLAVYNIANTGGQCQGLPAYRDGAPYHTGDVVVNGGKSYGCLVGGWCSIGGDYAPGTGWAWPNAWEIKSVCN
jgi:M6 family metalloprotease-like protein